MARISKEKQSEIRKKILSVSKEKFNNVGFEKTSTKEIAKEVGIAEGTLFNYFESKTEIFFEAFGEEYRGLSNNLKIEIGQEIVPTLFEYFEKNLSLMLKLPRGVLSELIIASVRMARKKPERFKKLIDLDFAFMKQIEVYIDQLMKQDIVQEVNSKVLSEIIYSVVGYELILYVYDKSIHKDVMIENMKIKVDIIMNGYIK